MKKTLSILLVLVLLLSLVSLSACAEKTQNDAPVAAPDATAPPADTTTPPAEDSSAQKTETVNIGGLVDVAVVTAADGTVTYNGKSEAELADAKNCEYVPEKLAAGKEVLFAYCLEETTSDDVNKRVAGLCAALEAMGFTTGTSDAQLNSATQIAQIENYVTMGAAMVHCVVGSIASFEDITAQAMANGTYISYWGQLPAYDTMAGIYAFDQVALGSQQGQMASDWVDMMWPDAGPGEVRAALLGQERNEDTSLRTFSIRDAFLENPKVQIAYYVNDRGGIEASFTATEEALTTDPGLRVFLTFGPGMATGCSNYLISQVQSGLDLSQYGVFSCTEDATILEMIDMARTDPSSSPLRGTVGYDNENPWDGEFELVTDLLLGGAETPHYVFQKTRIVQGF